MIKILTHPGEPFGQGLPPWHLLKEVRKKHKVAIVGIGGDELFGNYNRPYKILKNFKSKIYKISKFKKKYFYNSLYNADSNFKKKYTNLKLEQLKNPAEKYFNKILLRKNKFSKFDNLSLLDFDLGLVDDYLFYSDRSSMAHSVELRTPYLDHKLVELALSLSEKVRVNKNLYKPILRFLAKLYLPVEYLEQTKKGFSAPLSLSMRGNLKNFVKELLSKENLRKVGIINEIFHDDYVEPMLRGENNNIQLIWNILILQIWFLRVSKTIKS